MSIEANQKGAGIELLFRTKNEMFSCEKYASYGDTVKYEISLQITKDEAKEVIRQLLYCI
jgi:hypothetical protein